MSEVAAREEAMLDLASIPGVDFISQEEGVKLFDELAHEYFGITGDEFIRRYRAGEIEDYCDSNVIMLAMIIPWTEP